ncbi:hypothetical protein V8B97DRAFT_1871500 [Scleroderma yunnanense]
MGTHISRVKSIDLDMWTPEQMDVRYLPPSRNGETAVLTCTGRPTSRQAIFLQNSTKMESYVRSKYESRRWALDGPPPSDPSVLEGGQTPSNNEGTTGAASPSADPPVPASPRATHTPTRSLSAPRAASPSLTLTSSPFTRHQQPQPRQLLSAAVAGRITSSTQSLPSASATPQAQTQTQSPQPPAHDDLFSLDFHTPPAPKSASAPPPPVKDVKQDILSLFSAPTPARTSAAAPQSSNAFGQFASAQPSWDAFGAAAQQQPTSMMGTDGVGMWGASSGWTAPVSNNTNNIWNTPSSASTTTNNHLGTFNTTDIWASSWNNTSTAASNSLFTSSQTPAAPKKDNIFGDLWGDFK